MEGSLLPEFWTVLLSCQLVTMARHYVRKKGAQGKPGEGRLFLAGSELSALCADLDLCFLIGPQ